MSDFLDLAPPLPKPSLLTAKTIIDKAEGAVRDRTMIIDASTLLERHTDESLAVIVSYVEGALVAIERLGLLRRSTRYFTLQRIEGELKFAIVRD